MIKSVSLCSSTKALRQVNPIHEKGYQGKARLSDFEEQCLAIGTFSQWFACTMILVHFGTGS